MGVVNNKGSQRLQQSVQSVQPWRCSASMLTSPHKQPPNIHSKALATVLSDVLHPTNTWKTYLQGVLLKQALHRAHSTSVSIETANKAFQGGQGTLHSIHPGAIGQLDTGQLLEGGGLLFSQVQGWVQQLGGG